MVKDNFVQFNLQVSFPPTSSPDFTPALLSIYRQYTNSSCKKENIYIVVKYGVQVSFPPDFFTTCVANLSNFLELITLFVII